MPGLGRPETIKMVVVAAGFPARHVAGLETRGHGDDCGILGAAARAASGNSRLAAGRLRRRSCRR
jgi:hypothetical protein